MLKICSYIDDCLRSFPCNAYVNKKFESDGTNERYGLWCVYGEHYTYIINWMLNMKVENKVVVNETISAFIFKTHKYNNTSELCESFYIDSQDDVYQFCDYVSQLE